MSHFMWVMLSVFVRVFRHRTEEFIVCSFPSPRQNERTVITISAIV